MLDKEKQNLLNEQSLLECAIDSIERNFSGIQFDDYYKTSLEIYKDIFKKIYPECQVKKEYDILKRIKEIRIEAIKHLIGKWGLKNKEKKIINIIEKDNQNIGKIEEKTTLDENKMTKIQKEFHEIENKEGDDAFVEQIEILNKLNKFKVKDKKEKDNDKNNLDEKEEIIANIEEDNETLKEEEIKEEKAVKHNNNIKEINNRYGEEI